MAFSVPADEHVTRGITSSGPCGAEPDGASLRRSSGIGRPTQQEGRTTSVDRPPASRVTLLDGFHLEVPGRQRRSTTEDLPREVQRLVAHLCLASRPTRTATAGHLWPDVREAHAHAVCDRRCGGSTSRHRA